jgi:transcriptional regulator with XRE-family HTH domain
VADPLTPMERLQKQVFVWRKRRNLSVQGVADRIAEIGGSLSRVAISRIERGIRTVNVDELLQLAHALAVPPAQLLVDLEGGEPVKIADKVVLYPWLAHRWIVGEEPPVMTNRTVTRAEEWHQAQTSVRLYAEQMGASNVIVDAQSDLRAAGFVGDGEALGAARGRLVEGLRQLAASLDEMIEAGMTPPPQPPTWIDRIRDLRLSKYPDSLRSVGHTGPDLADLIFDSGLSKYPEIWRLVDERPRGPVSQEQLAALLRHLDGRPDLQEMYVKAFQAGEQIPLPEGFDDGER